MEDRRRFLKTIWRLFAGMTVLSIPFVLFIKKTFAKGGKSILPRFTEKASLINENPRYIDTRNLELTPLTDFSTMGETEYRGHLEGWRLEISGHVETPVTLTFKEVLSLPSIEKDVLLICPGFFVNHGRWKGISLGKLIQKCGIKPDVKQIEIIGQDGEREKKRFFPIDEVQSDDIFLAYAVNGVILPEKHGAPLRVVAGDYYGSDWIKYVHKISLERR